MEGIESISAKLSMNHESLRQWVRRAEAGAPTGLTTERARIKHLEPENQELRSGHVLEDYYCDVVIVGAITHQGFEQDVDVLARREIG